jgi:PIN domain nuclease of toxin-antitoxin system
VRLLLDTHTALWFLLDQDQLGANANRVLDDRTNEILLSAVVPWEIAIKRGLGKLEAPADYLEQLLSYDVVPLPITLAHAAAVETLPDHHRDPFDRLLIAQALTERSTIVTNDTRIRAYDVPVLW